MLAEALCRAWAAGAGPGDERLIVDVDSFVGEVYGYDKQGAGYGYTHKRGYHPIVATRADTGEDSGPVADAMIARILKENGGVAR